MTARASSDPGRTRLIWGATILLTLVGLVFQRAVGPTRPVRGEVQIAGRTVRYVLPRTHGGSDDCPVTIADPDSQLQGWILTRRYKTGDEWTTSPMTRAHGRLTGLVPHQPPGGKVLYKLFLGPPPAASGGGDGAIVETRVAVPLSGPVVVRFRGAVPAVILGTHIFCMFLGMLWSNRAGVEALRRRPRLRRLTLLSFAFLLVGGLIFGPAVQWYSFGQAWTGYPNGTDLTDNKTLIAVLFWALAVAGVLLRRGAARAAAGGVADDREEMPTPWGPRGLVLLAALVTLVVFAVPHSVRGTELDYSKLPASGQTR